MPRSITGAGILRALLTCGKGMLYKMHWQLPVSCKALGALCEAVTDQMHWLKSSSWSLISAPEPTFVPFSPFPSPDPKSNQGREATLLALSHLTFSSLLHSDLHAMAGYRLSWSWSDLYASHWGSLLGQAGYEFQPLGLTQAVGLPSCPSWPSPFTLFLRTKNSPSAF